MHADLSVEVSNLEGGTPQSCATTKSPYDSRDGYRTAMPKHFTVMPSDRWGAKRSGFTSLAS